MEPNFDLMVDETEGHMILSLTVLNDMQVSGRQKFEGSKLPKQIVREMARECGKNPARTPMIVRQPSNPQVLEGFEDTINTQKLQMEALKKELSDTNVEKEFLQRSLEGLRKRLARTVDETATDNFSTVEMASELRATKMLVQMNQLRMQVLEGMAAKTTPSRTSSLVESVTTAEQASNFASYDVVREISQMVDECQDSRSRILEDQLNELRQKITVLEGSSRPNSCDSRSTRSTTPFDTAKELDNEKSKDLESELEKLKTDRAKILNESYERRNRVEALEEKNQQLEQSLQQLKQVIKSANSSSENGTAATQVVQLQQDKEFLKAANQELKRQLAESNAKQTSVSRDNAEVLQMEAELRKARTNLSLMEHRIEVFENMHNRGASNNDTISNVTTAQLESAVQILLKEVEQCNTILADLQVQCTSPKSGCEDPTTPITIVQWRGRRHSKEFNDWMITDSPASNLLEAEKVATKAREAQAHKAAPESAAPRKPASQTVSQPVRRSSATSLVSSTTTTVHSSQSQGGSGLSRHHSLLSESRSSSHANSGRSRSSSLRQNGGNSSGTEPKSFTSSPPSATQTVASRPPTNPSSGTRPSASPHLRSQASPTAPNPPTARPPPSPQLRSQAVPKNQEAPPTRGFARSSSAGEGSDFFANLFRVNNQSTNSSTHQERAVQPRESYSRPDTSAAGNSSEALKGFQPHKASAIAPRKNSLNNNEFFMF